MGFDAREDPDLEGVLTKRWRREAVGVYDLKLVWPGLIVVLPLVVGLVLLIGATAWAVESRDQIVESGAGAVGWLVAGLFLFLPALALVGRMTAIADNRQQVAAVVSREAAEMGGGTTPQLPRWARPLAAAVVFGLLALLVVRILTAG